LPDDDEHDEESPYHVPLPELTGRHGYALQRGEDDDTPLDPGAPVAYVAEPMKQRPSALTIEGMIVGIGDAAHAAAKEGGSAQWLMRAIAAGFVLPTVLGFGYWLVERL
jgi:hypothetical protein